MKNVNSCKDSSYENRILLRGYLARVQYIIAKKISMFNLKEFLKQLFFHLILKFN